MRHKPSISVTIILIVLTILVITVFQAFWLGKNYREQKSLFNARTGFLFRGTLFELQAAKLRMDTSFHFHVGARQNLVGMSNVLIDHMKDLGPDRPKENRLVFEGMSPPHPLHFPVHMRYRADENDSGGRVFGFLARMDSLSDPITIKEISNRYRSLLVQEGIDVPFSIHILPADTIERPYGPFPRNPEDNIVSVGFTKPVSYQLLFKDNTWYLLKRITQPIMVSLLLLGLTIFSFLVLYKNQKQQQKLAQIKNDFINNMAHELKTPISTVSLAIETLRDFDVLEDSQTAREYLDISAGELQRLDLLVDKVLKLSMFEKSGVSLNKEPLNLLSLVKSVIASMRLQFDNQHAALALESSGRNFLVTADKVHITSMIYNLIDNALKYSIHDPVIQIGVRDQGDYIELQVTDQGRGIPKEYEKKIFEKFFRVPDGNHHNVKGYGLGLSYVSYIVQRHSGLIAVKSEPGEGSTFLIKLPHENMDATYHTHDGTAQQVKKVT